MEQRTRIWDGGSTSFTTKGLQTDVMMNVIGRLQQPNK